MKIILDDKYYIEDNGAGYTLTREPDMVLDKTGKLKPTGGFKKYPGTLQQTIITYMRYSTHEKIDSISLKDYINLLTVKTDELIAAITGKKYDRKP